MSAKTLFRITEGSNIWTFTSSNQAEVYNTETYSPRVVGRSDIKDTPKYLKDTVEVSFPLMDSIAQHFLQSPIDYVARIQIIVKDANGTFRTEWRGTLKDVKPSNRSCKLVFNSAFASDRTAGRRPIHSRTCPHAIYSGLGCTVSLDAFKTAGNVSAISTDGLTLTIAEADALPDAYLNGGVLVMPDNTMRYIKSHVGSTVKILRKSPSLNEAFAASSPVAVFMAPGCNQTFEMCRDRFSNWLEYGGHLDIPKQNPHEGAII